VALDRIVAGNRLTLLKNGSEFFPALEAAINGAGTDVRIETYIFHDDDSGRRIAAALMRAAARGVQVFVLVDGFGSRETPSAFFSAMSAAGVKLQIYRADPRLRTFRKSQLRRVHRKIALVDGRVGFVGGINLIGDLTAALSEVEPRYDYAVQIEGPLLRELYPLVQWLWRLVEWWKARAHVALLPSPPVSADAIGTMQAAVIARDNFRHRRDIESAYLEAMAAATQSILIVSSYFLPGRKVRRALVEAASRGVNVKLLLQGRADHPLMQLATRALYTQLLGAGVIIHEYQIAMLHAKVAVVDEGWATVGSSNLDPFSLVLNREVNIVVLDREFATRLRASIEQEIARGAEPLDRADWQKRALWRRVQSWLAFGFTRLVAGWAGLKDE
jgi:cardiolipin synthase